MGAECWQLGRAQGGAELLAEHHHAGVQARALGLSGDTQERHWQGFAAQRNARVREHIEASRRIPSACV